MRIMKVVISDRRINLTMLKALESKYAAKGIRLKFRFIVKGK